MHFLAHVGHPRYAQAFVDYLQTLDIPARIALDERGAKIYLEQSDTLEQAQQELAIFLKEPNHERYRQASWLKDEGGSEAVALSRFYRGNSMRAIVKSTGLITKSIVVICAIVFFITDQGMNKGVLMPFMFFQSLAEIGESLQQWRWVTPAIIHFGIFHFVFNMASWWIFGSLIEKTQASQRLLMLFFICAVISNFTQFFWSGNRFGGLSGVVYGLLGYLWFYARFNPQAAVRLPQGVVVIMLITLAFGFSDLLPMANQAHLSGLLSGCVMGWWFGLRDKSSIRM